MPRSEADSSGDSTGAPDGFFLARWADPFANESGHKIPTAHQAATGLPYMHAIGIGLLGVDSAGLQYAANPYFFQ